VFSTPAEKVEGQKGAEKRGGWGGALTNGLEALADGSAALVRSENPLALHADRVLLGRGERKARSRRTQRGKGARSPRWQ
jgi:hypothetical protein